MVTLPLPRQPVPMLDKLFGEEFFPNIQPKPPLMQPETIFSHPVASYLGEETDICLATTCLQIVAESEKVSPEPPFLQTKQPPFFQLLLIGLVL